MSFATSVKDELIHMTVKSACCRRSLLYGLMLSAECAEKNLIYHTDNEAVAELVDRLLHENGVKEIEYTKGVYAGRPRLTHRFALSKLSRFLSEVEEGAEPMALLGKQCTACPQSFLRGVFLSVGTVSDPSRSYHAELLFADGRRADAVDAFLAALGLSARRIVRGKRIGLYYKNSMAIEELFAEMGGNRAVFRLANAKIERDIRNNENRATNCDARNIARSVSAARLQISAIEELSTAGMLDGLSEDLRETARLRLAYAEDSLSELAARHEPPISKSGLNYRLAALRGLADKIKKR